MANDFSYSVGVTGVDGAVGDIRRVQEANEQAASALIQKTNGSIQALERLRQANAQQLEAATTAARQYQALARESSGAEREEAQARLQASRQFIESKRAEASQIAAAMRQVESTTRNTTATVVDFGTRATQAGRGAGQAFSAIGQGVSAMGRGTPVIAGLGSAVSQVGAAVGGLAGAFGPLGIAMAAITVATAAANLVFDAQERSMESARTAADNLTTSLQGLITAEQQRRDAARLEQRLVEGGGTGLEQQRLVQQRNNRVSLLTDATLGASSVADYRAREIQALLQDNGDNGINRRSQAAVSQLRQPGENGQGPEIGDRSFFGPLLSDDQVATLIARRDQADQQFRQSLEAETVAARRRADEEAAREAEWRRAGLAAQSFGAAPPAPPGDEDRRRGGGGGGRRAATPRQADFVNLNAAAASSRDRAERATASALDRDVAFQAGYSREARDAEMDRLREVRQERERFTQAFVEAQQEMTRAQEAWANSSATSIEAVIAQSRQLNDAMRASGRVAVTQSQVMDRGFSVVAGSIAETVGGTMVGAFDKAVGAWLDGSKTFVQAAEEMALGVIKSLTQRAIVEAVSEAAQAIASAARYDAAGAALHGAAAAAWAGVGVAAGSLGLAVGAFGGGNSKSGGAAPAGPIDTGIQNGAAAEAANAPVIINLYPGNVLGTSDDVAEAVASAMEHARRIGRAA
jgi:hypothetical protein